MPKITEDQYNKLCSEFGKDVVDQWNKNFADHSFRSDNRLLKVHGLLFKIKGSTDKVTGAIKAIDALRGASATDSPGTTLRNFKAVFDGLRGLMPYVPGLYEFMAGYSAAMDGIAGKLDEIANAIRNQEEGAFVAHPGAWPGGWTMYNFMKILMKSSQPVEVPEDVVEWTKDHRTYLSFISGTPPPASSETLFGIDFLWPDTVDDEGLKNCFFLYRKDVKQFIYRDTALTLEEFFEGGGH